MMKKLFTSLLLLTALLCSNVVKAEDVVVCKSGNAENFQIVKVSDTEYRINPIDATKEIKLDKLTDPQYHWWDSTNGANDGQTRLNAFKACTGEITITGKVKESTLQDGNDNQNFIAGLKSLNFTEVDFSNLVFQAKKTVYEAEWNYQAHELVGKLTQLTAIKDYFPNAVKVSLPNDEENVYVDYFKDATSTVEEITFGTGTKKILCKTTNTTGQDNGVWSTWDAQQQKDAQGKYPFTNAVALKTLNFNSGLEEIGTNTFWNCPRITSLSFPESLKVIGINAFKNNRDVTTLDFSGCKNLETIDASAFAGKADNPWYRSQITNVTLPPYDTFTGFGNYVFSSTSVETLDFTNCTGITRFLYDGGSDDPQFEGGLKTFYWYSSLKHLYLPPKLEYIMNDVFGGMANSASIVLEDVTFTGSAVCENYNVTNPLVIAHDAFRKIGTLKTVNFSNNVTVIGNESFQNTGLTSVSIPASVEQVGIRAFSECTAMTTVTFEEVDKDCGCKHAKTVIAGEHRKQAVDEEGNPLFDDEGNPVPIPVLDENGNQKLDNLGFPLYEREGDGNGAFFNAYNIQDVYINAKDADIICENKAFDYRITFGQTQFDAKMATLHYPAGEEEKYVNLQHYLTDVEAGDPGLFQAWLQKHFNWATNPNNNGYHEFVNSGPSGDPNIPVLDDGDVILRTFSDYNYARIVPKGMKAYIVKKVERPAVLDSENKPVIGADGKPVLEPYYHLTLQSIPVIPAQTGVILYGEPNANAQSTDGTVKKTLSMTAVAYAPREGNPYRRDYWDDLATELSQAQKQAHQNEPDYEPDNIRLKNYLMPLLTSDGTNMEVKPYEKDPSTGKVIFRNFAMGRFDDTRNLSHTEGLNFDKDNENFVGFFRIIAGSYKSGYAYLHLTDTEYPQEQGAECIVDMDTKYQYEYNESGAEYNATTAEPWKYWKYANWTDRLRNWGTRPSRFDALAPTEVVKYLGEIEEDADGIVKLVIPADNNNDGDYYTLQGVKVNNPTQGVYIRNGKKVIIK